MREIELPNLKSFGAIKKNSGRSAEGVKMQQDGLIKLRGQEPPVPVTIELISKSYQSMTKLKRNL